MKQRIFDFRSGNWNLVFLLLVSVILAGCQAGASEDGDDGEEESDPVIPVEAAEVISSTVTAAYEGTAALGTAKFTMDFSAVNGTAHLWPFLVVGQTTGGAVGGVVRSAVQSQHHLLRR